MNPWMIVAQGMGGVLAATGGGMAFGNVFGHYFPQHTPPESDPNLLHAGTGLFFLFFGTALAATAASY